jgi:glycosyltransferase involved in cell wall biosynthesis
LKWENAIYKMRIAFDSEIFSVQSYGGVSRYFVRLAEQLISRNQDVGVFAPFHRNHYLKELPTGLVHGYGLNRYTPKSSRLILPLNRLVSKIAIKRWMPDVVHETYYSRLKSSPKRCPTVITVYDMIHELFNENFSSRDRTSQLKRIAIDRADHVICISESTRKDLIRLFDTDEKKVSVVHLGFEKFSVDKQSCGQFPATKRPYLLYVGSRGMYKNFNDFVRAVALSKRLKKDFDILTFGGGSLSRLEVALLSELGFKPDQVKQLGGDDKLLGQLYGGAAAFVYPSLYEGFGLPPLEAMAHNCPVISSNTSSMPEVIGDAAEFFNPAAIDDIAGAIERVVYTPSRCSELIMHGQKRLNNFSWGRCAEEALAIYGKLANCK